MHEREQPLAARAVERRDHELRELGAVLVGVGPRGHRGAPVAPLAARLVDHPLEERVAGRLGRRHVRGKGAQLGVERGAVAHVEEAAEAPREAVEEDALEARGRERLVRLVVPVVVIGDGVERVCVCGC